MKPPRQFFQPLAIGAPAPFRELPVKLERMIHFVPPHVEKVTAKVPELARQVDVVLGNLEDAIPADAKEAARNGFIALAKATDFGATGSEAMVNVGELRDLSPGLLRLWEFGGPSVVTENPIDPNIVRKPFVLFLNVSPFPAEVTVTFARPAGGAVTRTGDSNLGSRSREEIERVFDTNKGAIYTLYNRALRENPALQGKVVLRLTISPDGRVTFCEVVSSELNDPELEKGLVQRVLQFQFEARDDVEAITTTKPIDFFPA